MDDFNPVFDSPPSTKAPEHAAHGSNAFASGGSFGDFTESPVQTPAPPAPVNTAVADNHDWDAIFAGLDSPAQTGAAADTTAAAAAPIGNGTAAAATKDVEQERPAIGRALTETGVHDDPILKNLTGMGYARKDALAALEKYDYNLERVSSS
jgi:epidermal growth factor receptor substrate 15